MIPTPPSVEQEVEVLQRAMVECERRLTLFRREGDEMAASLAEADLNTMIERYASLAAK